MWHALMFALRGNINTIDTVKIRIRHDQKGEFQVSGNRKIWRKRLAAAAAIILALLTTGMYTCDSFIYAYAEDTRTPASSQSAAISSPSQQSGEGSESASTKENAASESGGGQYLG